MSDDKDSQIRAFKELANQALFNCSVINTLAKELKQTNEQWFLDWQDKLNEISVADLSKT